MRLRNLQSPITNLHSLAIPLLLFLLAFGAVALRLDVAPDLFTDEILYTRAGIRVAEEGALVWDSGRPLVVHPPGYFLVEAAYLKLTGIPAGTATTPGDIFTAVTHARRLNAIIAGITAVLFYGLGRRLWNWKLGLLLAALFLLDPFGVRINRRAMLETLAACLTLAGMAVLLLSGDDRTPLSRTRALAGGALLGLALLTKDLAFTGPLAVLLAGAWAWWRHRERRFALPYALAAAVAGAAALTVPLWALLSGHWERFADVKLFALQRLVGLAHTSGWNRPEVTIFDFLQQRLADYGSTYLLLGVGGAAVVFLLLFWRHTRPGRVLVTWGLVLYPFYGFVALFGSGNDQFFYFLLLPAILFTGVAAAVFVRALSARWPTRWHRLRQIGLGALLLVILPYNLITWSLTYDVNGDDGYAQLANFVAENIPAGTPINASGDALKFRYFFPTRPVADAATPEEAQAEGIRIFVLSPKDVAAGYGRITPELAAWLRAEGDPLFAVDSDSYEQILLYRVDYDGPTAPADATPRTFPVAESAPITPFLLLLGAWALAVTGAGLYWHFRPGMETDITWEVTHEHV